MSVSNLDFASITKFFVFLLLGVVMIAGLVGFAPNADDSTLTSIISFIKTGYGMMAIGAVIIGAAAVLRFTDYI